eukprot:gnl/TRDRNA2_/TRDRNA2_169689_c1_seq1.p1 gnl/TRDRNA2_/TRDRNA2_169689_c1~~gnl/TRDRNA2_/TRDRNA2_169689_c1_seq1.p1  ORF type:complete len:266 (-),score=33.81 gnl/TRDRNA2_/TRDRNA2_169689_c1_seq1:32-829(-)
MVPLEVAWGLYAFHMVCLPVWLGVGLRALHVNTRSKVPASKEGDHTVLIPAEGEYYAIRLLLLYPIADFVRGVDLCFDCTNGSCYAIWGFIPLWLRFAAWAVRDLALLGAVSVELEYILGWTFKALGRPSPAQEHRMLRGAWVFALCGLSGSFLGVMVTNRQSWQAVAVGFPVCLNLVWFRINFKLRRRVIPELESRLPSASALTERPLWASTLLGDARFTIVIVLAANLIIIVSFTLLAAERIILKKAHWKPFAPDGGLGVSVA